MATQTVNISSIFTKIDSIALNCNLPYADQNVPNSVDNLQIANNNKINAHHPVTVTFNLDTDKDKRGVIDTSLQQAAAATSEIGICATIGAIGDLSNANEGCGDSEGVDRSSDSINPGHDSDEEGVAAMNKQQQQQRNAIPV